MTCRTLIGKVEATFKSGEVAQAPWLFAADGARSTVRHAMKLDFNGSAFKTEWSLVDVPMNIDLPEDRAHILFLPAGGFLFVMRVVGDDRERIVATVVASDGRRAPTRSAGWQNSDRCRPTRRCGRRIFTSPIASPLHCRSTKSASAAMRHTSIRPPARGE